MTVDFGSPTLLQFEPVSLWQSDRVWTPAKGSCGKDTLGGGYGFGWQRIERTLSWAIRGWLITVGYRQVCVLLTYDVVGLPGVVAGPYYGDLSPAPAIGWTEES